MRDVSWRSRWLASGLLLAVAATAAQAQPTTSSKQPHQRTAWHPSSLYLQAGVAEDAQATIAGATWDWRWQRELGSGVVTGYWEFSLGQWQAEGPPRNGHALVTQLGVTPTFRLQRDEFSRGFVELGIGANVLMPVYRSAEKRFSTAFNFGDHIGLGWRFGQRRQHELALRLQHFSNAGIKDPNPGENFLQLRYSLRL